MGIDFKKTNESLEMIIIRSQFHADYDGAKIFRIIFDFGQNNLRFNFQVRNYRPTQIRATWFIFTRSAKWKIL